MLGINLLMNVRKITGGFKIPQDPTSQCMCLVNFFTHEWVGLACVHFDFLTMGFVSTLNSYCFFLQQTRKVSSTFLVYKKGGNGKTASVILYCKP